MGGNATVQFGTKRLSKQNYEKVVSVLNKETNDVLKKFNLSKTSKFSPTTPYSDKESFGDVDYLLTGDLKPVFFEKYVLSQNAFKVLGKVNNSGCVSYAVQVLLDSGFSEPFQLDLMYFEKNYDFALSYYSYNDLSNLLGQVATFYGFKLGYDGFYARLYFDKYGNKQKFYHLKTQQNTNLQNNFQKDEVKLTENWDKALEFLGYDAERYKRGFKNLEEIFEFVLSSHLFQGESFLLENRNHKARTRDKKRETYNKFLEYLFNNYPEKLVRNDNDYMDDDKLSKFINQEFSHYVQEFVKKQKRIRTHAYYGNRTSFDYLNKVFHYHFNVLFVKDNGDFLFDSLKQKPEDKLLNAQLAYNFIKLVKSYFSYDYLKTLNNDEYNQELVQLMKKYLEENNH